MKKTLINVAAVAYGVGYAVPRAFVRAVKRLEFSWTIFFALIALQAPKLWSLLQEALR